MSLYTILSQDTTGDNSQSNNVTDDTKNGSDINQVPKSTTTTGIDDLKKTGDEVCQVVIHEMPSVNLVSEKVAIPLRIINTCKKDIDVQVQATSDDSARLEPMLIPDVTLKADADNVVELPVHAKANGDSELTVQVTSVQTEPASITVQVHSVRDIGTVVGALFYIVIGVLIIGGTIRMVLRYRKSRHSSTDKTEKLDKN